MELALKITLMCYAEMVKLTAETHTPVWSLKDRAVSLMTNG